MLHLSLDERSDDTKKSAMRFGFSLVRASIPLLAVLSFPRPATPQSRVNYLPDKIGVWRRWEIICSGSGYGLSKEQTRVYADKLQKMSEVIHHAKVFSPPLGIEVQASGCVDAGEFLDDYPDNRKGPVPGYLMVGRFSYALPPDTRKIAALQKRAEGWP